MRMTMVSRYWNVSSHHGTVLLGALSRSIACDALWSLEMREDLEQQLVRNHRHRRPLTDNRSNHRHRQDGLLDP